MEAMQSLLAIQNLHTGAFGLVRDETDTDSSESLYLPRWYDVINGKFTGIKNCSAICYKHHNPVNIPALGASGIADSN